MARFGEEEDATQLEIKGERKSVFVEVKATTGDTVRMSVPQVEQAVLHQDRYFLCVVRVADAMIDTETFKTQAKIVVDIGSRLEQLWNEYCSMESVLGEFKIHDSDLTVERAKQEVRFGISRVVWSGGEDFISAIELLREYVLRK